MAKTPSIRVALFLVVVVLVSSCAIVVMVTIPDDLTIGTPKICVGGWMHAVSE